MDSEKIYKRTRLLHSLNGKVLYIISNSAHMLCDPFEKDLENKKRWREDKDNICYGYCL